MFKQIKYPYSKLYSENDNPKQFYKTLKPEKNNYKHKNRFFSKNLHEVMFRTSTALCPSFPTEQQHTFIFHVIYRRSSRGRPKSQMITIHNGQEYSIGNIVIQRMQLVHSGIVVFYSSTLYILKNKKSCTRGFYYFYQMPEQLTAFLR